jgi:hypothetical protein
MATHKQSNFLSKAWVAEPEAMTFIRAEKVSTESWIHSWRNLILGPLMNGTKGLENILRILIYPSDLSVETSE